MDMGLVLCGMYAHSLPCWLVLGVCTQTGWPGWVDLGGCLHSKLVYLSGLLATYLSTNEPDVE